MTSLKGSGVVISVDRVKSIYYLVKTKVYKNNLLFYGKYL